ncbi:MAG: phospholipase D/transphosphatidylase [Candidatus Magasanikbacteria bacterium GW2011_GWC2_40_17]|uniref:Phospholipase D/transphosphatidylase n=1 Tax=Candidatus Magasanikbacteria bacterium GW2011_GWA2_42_32 TaxID=1619039 RepID=A0A0G1D5V0_9BACT|nr:MAG: phospholipase D/transphosphatidylase [Candidatus Magasanikbacteria bacterium GW2011_GWC2_40_17]KKS57433.1 MAG: phospholipase D/transphosphatidylase [Candidatus Magasanikbacteria bacterium GW2011_GWA2_42_32]OGH85575.1 MAG: hypothetical protein A2294_01695 [Candidatus Magasanikbacteria bacterium RIFOXYB2_FULL_38_10]
MPANTDYKFFATSAQAWEGMLKALAEARHSIYWETYIFEADEIGQKFIKILKEKAHAGLEVKLILDGFGSAKITEEIIKDLKGSGVDVLYFNPIKIFSFWRGLRHFFERTHRKFLIIDRRIAFIGSVNVQDVIANWLDLQIMVEGPIVNQLLKAFSRSYLISGGALEKIKHLFYLPIIKEKKWRILWHKPLNNFSIIRKQYLKAIKMAQISLILVVPYFLPDPGFLKALREAKKRGVNVQIILPWETDHVILTYAMRSYWVLWASLGFKIFLVKKMIHAKAILIDDKWAMVGSSNVDAQTFYRNHEINLIFTDKKMIMNLKNIFLDWKKKSRLFRPIKWSQRSFRSHLWEFLAKLLEPFL